MTVITLFLSLLSGVVLSRLRGIGHEVQDKVMCIYYSHGINLLDIFSSMEQNTQMQPLLLSANCGFFLQKLCSSKGPCLPVQYLPPTLSKLLYLKTITTQE